jgi:uncharacterized protein involved in response to NO
MNSLDSQPALHGVALRLLAAAPHRLLFFVGAANVLLAMGWWTLWLIDARWQVVGMPQPAVFAGWMHAIIMQYQVLPSFMFGFLLTVFPRWMSLPPLARRHYVPVGIGMLGGQALTLAGLLAHPRLLQAGIALTLLGWSIGLFWLLRLLGRETGCTWHAMSCAGAIALGWLGLTLFAIYSHTLDPGLAFAAIKIGSFGLLLPIFFTVCHRMVPFFAGSVIPGYVAARPMWALAAFWVLAFTHLLLELAHGYAWLWLPDLPLAVLTGGLLSRWWPRNARMPALLRVLFVGFAWLPVAMLLYAGQSLWFAVTSEFVLGRAPAHALFVGFFGSLLVAMVTRVTQGHSGRPLQLGRVAGFAFVAVQIVAVTRIAADLAPDAPLWQAVAAVGWMLAFTPWVLRSCWIFLTPRIDRRPG